MSESKEIKKIIEKPKKKRASKRPSKVTLVNTNKFSALYSYGSEEYQINSRGKVLNLEENKLGLPLAKGLIIIKESF